MTMPPPTGRRDTLAVPERYRSRSETAGVRSLSPGYANLSGANSAASSNVSLGATGDFLDEEEPQDILEVWFPGCHAVRYYRQYSPLSIMSSV